MSMGGSGGVALELVTPLPRGRVLDLYSNRKRIAEGKMPDVFVYDELPEKLRHQIIHIWKDAIGDYDVSYEYGNLPRGNNKGWEYIHDTVTYGHGLPELSDDRRMNDRCANYLCKASVDDALDLIQVSFDYIDKHVRNFDYNARTYSIIKLTANAAIEELNACFLFAGVGYQFENGEIIRVDSELIHNEIVRPALHYLNQPGFEVPRDEFMTAHEHYRAGEMKAAIVDANNAFESTLKKICDQRDWKYKKGVRAVDLLKLVREKGLLPDHLGKSFEQLAATLKSGLPVLRNEEGAHGQGPKPRETPRYVAAYALHLAAVNILFLVEAYHAKYGEP